MDMELIMQWNKAQAKVENGGAGELGSEEMKESIG